MEFNAAFKSRQGTLSDTFPGLLVAIVLALGDREAAGKQMEYWLAQMRDHDD